VSRFYNNKHYTDTKAYHNVTINGTRRKTNDSFVLINAIRDEDLAVESHVGSLIISDTNKDGKYVEHAVARDGSFLHYKKETYNSPYIKVNNAPINSTNVFSIMTSFYKRNTFSSKITTSAGGSETPAFSQTWVG